MTDVTYEDTSSAADRAIGQLTAPTIHYSVAMPNPESHLFEVTLRVQGWSEPVLDLKMPVWTPGSYLVREYARHLQDFRSLGGDRALLWRKISKNHWQIETNSVSDVTVCYRIFANELTVRTNHLDSTHGYFNPAALCFFLPGFERNCYTVTVVPPQPEWRTVTTLPPVSGEDFTFAAADFDTLVDSPFEIGCHESYDFEVMGKPHQLVVWGQGNLEPERAIQDIKKVIEVEAEMFGGLPYDRYVFLLHLSGSGFGGLEHKDSCTLNYSRFGFRNKDKYERFIQLVAHEFFHLWNVKRIRPKALEIFDYEQENYTPSLWFSEGTTSYYDLLIPFRAGLYGVKGYFQNLAKEITRLQTTPGRNVQPASESSWDAWIKLYRRDANSDNSQISYYLKGELVSFLLDLLIRAKHGNARSLDDVMRLMWQQFGGCSPENEDFDQKSGTEAKPAYLTSNGKLNARSRTAEIGFTPEELQSAIESVAGMDLSDFFARYVDGTEELPYNEYLEPFGLQIWVDESEQTPRMGWTLGAENGRQMVKFVEAGSPAQLAGIDAGDELLAIAGFRVNAEQVAERLKDYQPGDTVEVTVFHQDELRTCSVTLAQPRPGRYSIVPVDRPSTIQKQNFTGWLGVPLSNL
ncbi:MAG: M61 family metallopeptidase [Microcoleus sp. PH2017_29_MFU_D_A]|uniref:M61 family metallopeptidase n=1 Tax=unclassified Microcoleus TaxID=2642155 RepID=UPI001D9B1D58|nr:MULTISPECIES: M61 family metallopeptidase [unclassified Microcoleus]MCC3444410.1 M61 family metallopeptidase [Microcoleus sp. PH2017_03_ELD_O_A]MCC3465607.1 M61 family metallopeptidase [Microcoleus sp. PH2017_06_SFM_O_A]MCC3504392.1 M61 family metallopeptidase [Microcoleus sp. PH2017_19_SFW_U_A]TAE44228.1 MAG: M61 family peptidase [Oscillatoriales cyanobacterium]MCC3436072.1 M61 family metallopeptidase [Microcoleus sp. PH2017_05_CCC_O_A]